MIKSVQVYSKEIDVPVPWGFIKVQIFGDQKYCLKPIVGLPGYLDNSNSYKPLAPYLNDSGYYIVSIDYPGHGFSSHLPVGMPFTPFILLICVRRVIKYLGIEKFSLLTHSFGSFIGLMYSITYQNEIDKVVGLDSVVIVDLTESKHNIPYYWNRSIDEFIDAEKDDSNSLEKGKLTKEKALETLLKQNPNLNTESGLVLLERNLTLKDDQLQFTRDKRLKNLMIISDFTILADLLKEHFNHPFLLIYAYPHHMGKYGEKIQNYLISLLKSGDNKSRIETVKFHGTHHFHMIKPEKTANIILNFLNNDNINLSSKL